MYLAIVVDSAEENYLWRAMMVERSRFYGKDLLAGKRTVVTGGGLGIGRQIAYTFAEQGARVVIVDYKRDLAEAAAELINKDLACERVVPVVADVSDRGQLSDAFEHIDRHYNGSLDVFINNAGVNHPCRIEELLADREAQLCLRLVMINQVGAYWCAAHAYRLLLQGEDPAFFMVGSCASVGSEGQGVSSSTKSALRGLLGTLVKEWAGSGERPAVRVGLVEPDYFEETGLRSRQYLEDLAKSRRTSLESTENEAVVQRQIPLRREGKLVEIAEKLVMMTLDSYANGNVEVLSGGKTVRL